MIEIDLVTVLEAILTNRQPRKELQCLNENLMSNKFRRTAVLKNNMNCRLKLLTPKHSTEKNRGRYMR